MFVAAEQHDLPVRTRTGHQRPRWTSRLAVCVVVFAATLCSALGNLYAGCHYGHESFTESVAERNAREHARNFGFLGQWIYEGGEIKYVPRQNEAPCRGPNCHADDDQPRTTTSSPTTSLKRIPASLAFGWETADRFDALTGCIAGSNLFPISGYPHEHEYPP